MKNACYYNIKHTIFLSFGPLPKYGMEAASYLYSDYKLLHLHSSYIVVTNYLQNIFTSHFILHIAR